MRALLVVALVGCAQHHTVESDALEWRAEVDASASLQSNDGGPPRVTSSDGDACTIDADWCVPATYTPTIGVDRFCRSDHQWVPSLNYERGIANAHELCQHWVVCSGDPCFHCIDSGTEWRWWEGVWCGP